MHPVWNRPSYRIIRWFGIADALFGLFGLGLAIQLVRTGERAVAAAVVATMCVIVGSVWIMFKNAHRKRSEIWLTVLPLGSACVTIATGWSQVAYVAMFKELDLISQGRSHLEAYDSLIDALRLYAKWNGGKLPPPMPPEEWERFVGGKPIVNVTSDDQPKGTAES